MLKLKAFKAALFLVATISLSSQQAVAVSLRSSSDLIPDLAGLASNSLQVKLGKPYDEKNDPALRKGTENWEQDQGSYFIVPGLVLGIVALALFLGRNKPD